MEWQRKRIKTVKIRVTIIGGKQTVIETPSAVVALPESYWLHLSLFVFWLSVLLFFFMPQQFLYLLLDIYVRFL